MANRANLIATYNANPTLQAKYTLDQYLALFDFGQYTPITPTPTPTPTPVTPGIPSIINQNINRIPGGEGLGDEDDDETSPTGSLSTTDAVGLGLGFALGNPFAAALGLMAKNAIRNAPTTSFGNVFGFGPQGKDAFNNPVNVADVEIGLDQTNITPTNLNDYQGFDNRGGPSQDGAHGMAGRGAEDFADLKDGGRVYLYNRLK